MSFDLSTKFGGAVKKEQKKDEKKDEIKDENKTDKKYEHKTYTAKEQEELLENYHEIPIADVTKLAPKTLVRYTGTDGRFRIGGRVHNINSKVNPAIMWLSSGYGPTYFKWMVPVNKLKKVWISNAETLQVGQPTLQVGQPVEIDNDRLDDIEMEIYTIKEDMKKIISAIATLNSKITQIAQRPFVASARPQ
jgi:hypothetical protein